MLRSLIARTAFAITAEDARYYLAGALLVLDKDEVAMVATDGHRLSYARSKATLNVKEPQRVLVPRKAISELARLIEGEENVAFQEVDNHLVFSVGGRVLASKKQEGQFPAYEKVIGVTGDKVVKLSREAMTAGIRRVSLLSSERSRAIRLGLQKGQLELLASSPELGEAKESVPVEYAGAGVEVGFNAQYLLDFLAAAGADERRAPAQGRGEPGPPPARGQRRHRASLRRDAHEVLEVEVLLRRLEIRDVRRVQRAELDLDPGLNVFLGRNAQGKTTVLEGVGLLSRGRSFRSDDAPVRHPSGEPRLMARAATRAATGRETTLEVELSHEHPRVPGGRPRGAPARVPGTPRGRAVLDGALAGGARVDARAAAVPGPGGLGALALLPPDPARVRARAPAAQRGAPGAGRGLGAWSERLLEVASALRFRRAEYARRLSGMLARGFRPRGEQYEVHVIPEPVSLDEGREALREALDRARGAEQAAGRSLVGPHRDTVSLLVDGSEAEKTASAGQARSLLLALALAALEIYREERGEAAIALLDDLDSELDEERAEALAGRWRPAARPS